jgi:DNA-binding GntR family transcriptional regulator
MALRGVEGGGPGNRTLVEYASERLRESILAGELPPGKRVLLDSIAHELGISPIPLREALRTLATEGLVVPLPHRGYTVAKLTVPDLQETYRLRLLLEPLAVKLAVPRLTEVDIAHLTTELDLLARAFDEGNWPNHRTHHRSWHFGIYVRCESAWLMRFIDMLWLNSERYQRLTASIEGELRERMKEHRRIFAAVKAGDADRAASLMHEHLNSAEESLRAFLDANQHVLATEPSTASADPA